MDKFRVEVISQTANPQQVIWAAMHQDYCEDFVWDGRDSFPDEAKAGELIVKHLLMGNKGHYGPIEHPQIVFNVGYFPHSMLQQVRTHRVGISFDVQCLAGDTEITFSKTSGVLKKIKIAELYDLWVNGEKAVRVRQIRGRKGELPGQYRRNCQKRLKKMNLRVLNEETHFFETGHLKDVICSGVKDIYRVTLADGKSIDCTVNHRLFTSQGWQTMGDATGLLTDTDGKAIATTKQCFIMCNGLVVEDIKCREREFIEVSPPILKSINWKAKPRSSGNKLKAHPVEVIKVEYLGKQMTYDLEVEGRWHNFVANGAVVHNSFRYTGQRVIDVIEGKREIEDVFYLRPVGNYTNRQGKKYFYSQQQREEDLQWCLEACKLYRKRIEEGLSEEQARSIIPFDARQHFVMSCNARTLMHLIDMRAPANAQLECQELCQLLMEKFRNWMPQVAQWYEENRYRKSKLAP